MIVLENVLLKNYKINLELDSNRVGIFSRDSYLTEELLLILAGIIKPKGKCMFNGEEVYDNDKYFKSRIYIDCKESYLKTLNVNTIASSIKNKFQKNINEIKLKKHIDTLKIRGECEISFAFEYDFTPTGNTLINLSLALSLDDALIINNPTINLLRLSDINYIYSQFQKREGLLIFGLNSLIDMKHFFDRIICFTDYKEVRVINPLVDSLLLIDRCDIIDDYKLFNTKDGRIITLNLPLETSKRLQKQKIRIERISIYEIENYLPK
ncbi:MAG TPA: hypothetical protein GXZ48_04720 [Acholeplasmataceae bacterium]|nr:hypothetical protein [Acholeplasmataceae bacterium]